MSKTMLSTDWIAVASAGRTVDGREITETEIQEMAESYDPKRYTALIWLEHYRFQNFGQVLEVKAEKEDGVMKLFAKISPTAELIMLNKEGQKLFTSVEIMPNFANSGKAYLFGLAVTDSPASTGTTQINFSVRGIDPKVQFGNVEPFHFALSSENVSSTVLDVFKKLFGLGQSAPQPTAEATPQPSGENDHNQGNFTMTEEQMKAFATMVGTAVAVALHSQQKPTEPTPEKPAEQAKPTEAEGVTKADFNQLLGAVTALNDKFNQLQQEATPTPNGANPAITANQGKFTVTTAI